MSMSDKPNLHRHRSEPQEGRRSRKEPGEESEEKPDEELHADQADGVDQELFEEPGPAGWAAVVAGVNRFDGFGERGAEEDFVEDLCEWIDV